LIREAKLTDQKYQFSSLFGVAQIFCHPDDDRLDVIIHQLISSIGKAEPSIDVEQAYKQLLNLKGCGILIFKPGIAIVHIRVNNLKRLHLALATNRQEFKCQHLKEKMECINVNSDPIKLVILMMAPANDPVFYLRGVAALSNICKDQDFIDHLLSLEKPEDVWTLFEQADQALPEYIEARHIMRKDYSYLKISDKISTAIDLFCREGTNEYPVIDDDGDLVGIVKGEGLIKLCLPEYITWMEDLSPILNFEPFAEILFHEKNMPVMEIMMFAEHYATVDESTPAIQVAKVMLRNDVKQVYIVRDKKLMGIISIQDFIKMVLRS
jgi:CBS domain-containing protein